MGFSFYIAMKRLIHRSVSGRNYRRSRAFALIEVSVGIGALVVMSLLMLKASLSATVAQRWTVIQGMTDAYVTRETAVAKRVPFDEITAANSRWPEYPALATETIEIGRLPGGISVMAEVKRTRVASLTNFSSAGGGGSLSSNPAKMETWSLQSLLSYQLGGRDYVKSRTVVRSR